MSRIAQEAPESTISFCHPTPLGKCSTSSMNTSEAKMNTLIKGVET